MYSVKMAIKNDSTGKKELISIKVKDEDMHQFKNITTMSFGVGEPVIGKAEVEKR